MKREVSILPKKSSFADLYHITLYYEIEVYSLFVGVETKLPKRKKALR